MTNEWNNYAEIWDSIASEYADKVFEELLKITPLEGLRVLDFGCGTGLLSERLSPYVTAIVALDSADKMIDKLTKKNLSNVHVFCSELNNKLLRSSPLFQEEFDLIVASSVCGFLPNYSQTVSLLSSLLKTTGVFVQWDWLIEDTASGPGISKEAARKALLAAKLTDVEISTPFEMESEKGSMPVLMASGIKL